MKLFSAQHEDRETWNAFVAKNYPPIGAFMQSFEWGEFQRKLGRVVERWYIAGERKAKTKVAAFTTTGQSFLGFSYTYVPRGPIIFKKSSPEVVQSIFETLATWIGKKKNASFFWRLEPPLSSLSIPRGAYLYHPPYYIQPRYNIAVDLRPSIEKILESFHSSTRSNINRAEKRGVHVAIKPTLSKEELDIFFKMIDDTVLRNGDERAYPSRAYFRTLFETMPPLSERTTQNTTALCAFYGYQHGEPAAIHIVIFFGGTATYLFGASFSDRLRSKVTTYLHFEAMREAKRRGYQYYDLGGIDALRWPSITTFKRQFRGKEFSYLGNVDIVNNFLLYRLYSWLRQGKGLLSRFRNGKRKKVSQL